MNWRRTRLIFIAAFLILDVFLGVQLYEKRKSADEIPPLSETSTPEETLKENNITYPSDIPDISSVAYIKGENQYFGSKTDDGDGEDNDGESLPPELEMLEEGTDGKDVQDIKVGIGNTTIRSTFAEPLDVPENPYEPSAFTEFLNTYVYRGSEYRLWKVDESSESLIFVQTHEGRPVFSKSKNQTGSLQVWTEDGKMTKYQQSYLNFDTYGKEKNMVSATKAMANLLQAGDLPVGGTVASVELSYDNLIEQDLGDVKVFVPAWHILVETYDSRDETGYEEHFVNALTGVIQTLEEEETE